jgi:hypothetical protein
MLTRFSALWNKVEAQFTEISEPHDIVDQDKREKISAKSGVIWPPLQ